ncbi:MAG: hypothetical protein U0929_18365 [Planctomycetaceae bacterium]
MERFKIDHFLKSHPGGSFPNFETLGHQDTLAIRSRLAQRLGLAPDASYRELQDRIVSFQIQGATFRQEVMNQSLTSIKIPLDIELSSQVLIDWSSQSNIDRLKWDDFTERFHDIWYPSSEDIDVFDESLSWIMSVSHDGVLCLVKL